LRPQKPELGSLNHRARGPKKSWKIRRSTQRITKIMGTVRSNLEIRRRKDHSDDLPMQKSGVKFIALPDTIWKSAQLFWIARRCQHNQRHKSYIKVNIIELILTMRTRWIRST
jgi:hypothetical protein